MLSDVEALAEVLLAVDVTPAERAGMPLPAATYLIEANAGDFARAILTSDWLAAHDAEVRRETAGRIAQAIEARRDWLRENNLNAAGDAYLVGLLDALVEAARIARQEQGS